MLPAIKSEKTLKNEAQNKSEMKLPTISAGLARSNFLYEFIRTEKEQSENSIDKLQRFSRAHNAQQRRRQQYFEKRGLEAAIQRQVKLHSERIEAKRETVQLCERLTSKYNPDLQVAFTSLISEYAEKCFELSCTVTTLHSEVNKKERFDNEMEQLKEKIDDRKWRILREKERILRANQMLKEMGFDS